jgi:hypothetical protein
MMYSANTVHLSFTQSCLYMYADCCNTFVYYISFIFNFNVPPSVINNTILTFKILGPSQS